MTIFLADTSVQRLQSIALLINRVLPDAFVLSATDPLMAAKFAFTKPVDILIAKLYMPRITGLQLCEFVREKCADARVCLTATEEEFAACTQDLDAAILRIPLPVTKQALSSALMQWQKQGVAV